MFYCDACARKKGWMVTIFKSAGVCEICGEIKSCNYLPVEFLPEPKTQRKEANSKEVKP